MIPSQLEFGHLRSILGRRADDPAVLQVTRREAGAVERFDGVGYVDFREIGIDVIFDEERLLLLRPSAVDPRALRVAAIHFHRADHEGYSAYLGSLPNGVHWGDSEREISNKMGPPAEAGGGGTSTVLGTPISRWIKYLLGDSTLQFQLDQDGFVDMATLSLPRFGG